MAVMEASGGDGGGTAHPLGEHHRDDPLSMRLLSTRI